MERKMKRNESAEREIGVVSGSFSSNSRFPQEPGRFIR